MDETRPVEQPPPLDAALAQQLEWFSQRLSRRGYLAGVGRLMLKATGLAVAFELLPLDRQIPVAQAADQNKCKFWKYCGASGRVCGSCNGGADPDTCPPTCNEHLTPSWTRCCCETPGAASGRTITYRDCCGTAASIAALTCTACANHPTPQGVWGMCSTGTMYCCTTAKADTTTTCSPCHSCGAKGP